MIIWIGIGFLLLVLGLLVVLHRAAEIRDNLSSAYEHALGEWSSDRALAVTPELGASVRVKQQSERISGERWIQAAEKRAFAGRAIERSSESACGSLRALSDTATRSRAHARTRRLEIRQTIRQVRENP